MSGTDRRTDGGIALCPRYGGVGHKKQKPALVELYDQQRRVPIRGDPGVAALDNSAVRQTAGGFSRNRSVHFVRVPQTQRLIDT